MPVELRALQVPQPVQLTEDRGCGNCRIEFESVVQLGTPDGPGILEGAASVVRDQRGRYYVLGRSYSPEISVFGTDGTFLRTIGRQGGGPGEFRGIGFFGFSASDTLHVFDRNNVTETVLSPNYAFVRSHATETPPGIRGLVFPDGRSVLVANIRTAERIGLPLHLLGRDGRIVHSFGSTTGVYRPDLVAMASRVIVAAGEDKIWSAYTSQYVIELWDAREGMLSKRLERDVEWFTPFKPYTVSMATAPPTRIVDLRVDVEGLLWVIFRVAGPEWRDAVSPGSRDHARVIDHGKYRDTRIEVIDPNRGLVVTSMSLPEEVFFVDDDLVGYFAVEGDTAYLDIKRVHLVQH